MDFQKQVLQVGLTKFLFFSHLGYHVIAPDNRGYNSSFKSSDPKISNAINAAEDTKGLIEHYCNGQKAFLVGHDWGAVVTWYFTNKYGNEYLQKLIIMNGPHPLSTKVFTQKHQSQLLKSWYMFFFQLNGIAEYRIRKDDYAWFLGFAEKTEPITSLHILDMNKKSWNQEGAMEAMLGWYRYAIRHSLFSEDEIYLGSKKNITIPVKIIWGKRDKYLDSRLAEASLEYCDKGSLLYVDSAHFVQQEQPDIVNEAIHDFIKS